MLKYDLRSKWFHLADFHGLPHFHRTRFITQFWYYGLPKVARTLCFYSRGVATHNADCPGTVQTQVISAISTLANLIITEFVSLHLHVEMRAQFIYCRHTVPSNCLFSQQFHSRSDTVLRFLLLCLNAFTTISRSLFLRWCIDTSHNSLVV